MNKENLLEIIRKTADFNREEADLIFDFLEYREIKKKTLLLSPGKTAKELYFILKGCIRLYLEKDGREITSYFFTEPMLGGAFDSFITQRPTRHFMTSLEDSKVFVFNHQKLSELDGQFPKINEFMRKVIETRFVALHTHYTSLVLDSPEERYLLLLKNRPDLFIRVPQHQIATYLGITPVSLSRIRSRLSKKK